jgi:hypothetical protein
MERAHPVFFINLLVLEFSKGRDNPFDFHRVNEKIFDRENDVQCCIVNFDGVDIVMKSVVSKR